MTATAAAAIAEARKYRNYHEGRTGGVWNNVQKFGARYGWNGVAWCAIFLWCVFQDIGGGKLFPKSASCSNLWDHYSARKMTGKTPRDGALIFFGPGNHIGLVTGYTSSTVTYISGNTSEVPGGAANSVQEKSVSRSAPFGYAYPAYTKTPPPAPKPPSKLRRVITVRKGQTLGGIAAAVGISLAALLVLNPGYKSHPNLIHPGDRVTVPASSPKK